MALCDRRRFLAGGVATCALAMWPVHGTLRAEPDGAGRVDVGPRTTFARDGAVDTWAGRHRFFVVRQGGRLFAVHAICTHEDELLKAQHDKGRLYCAEHKSWFGLDGRVQKGKPKRPLPRLGIAVNDNGHVVVDPARRFDQPRWDDPAAFVEIA